mgnify:CR=1 FL=1
MIHDARNEDAVGAGLVIAVGAADRLLQRIGVTGEIAVGAGSAAYRGSWSCRRLRARHRCAPPPARCRTAVRAFGRCESLTMLYADDPDLDRLADGLGSVLRPRPIAALEIGADGNVGGTGDPPDARHHLLAVRAGPHSREDRGKARCRRSSWRVPESGGLEHARATGVPGVGRQECPLSTWSRRNRSPFARCWLVTMVRGLAFCSTGRLIDLRAAT